MHDLQEISLFYQESRQPKVIELWSTAIPRMISYNQDFLNITAACIYLNSLNFTLAIIIANLIYLYISSNVLTSLPSSMLGNEGWWASECTTYGSKYSGLFGGESVSVWEEICLPLPCRHIWIMSFKLCLLCHVTQVNNIQYTYGNNKINNRAVRCNKKMKRVWICCRRCTKYVLGMFTV